MTTNDSGGPVSTRTTRYVVLDYVVEVPDGADVDALIDRITDALTLAVEAEGASMGGGARPMEEAEVLARYDALEAARGAAAG